MKQNYSKPGEFVKILREEIKKSGKSTLILPNEIMAQTAQTVARRHQQPFQNAWTAIEKLSKAPLLEDIAPEVTINRLDLYYAGLIPSPETHRINTDRLRELMRNKYAKQTGNDSETVEQQKVQECFDEAVPKDWKGPVIYLHQKIDSFFVSTKKPDYARDGKYLSWIMPETSVAELFDHIIKAVENALE